MKGTDPNFWTAPNSVFMQEIASESLWSLTGGHGHNKSVFDANSMTTGYSNLVSWSGNLIGSINTATDFVKLFVSIY